MLKQKLHDFFSKKEGVVLATVILLCLLITISTIVYFLPGHLTMFDSSAIGIAELSDATLSFVGDLKEDVKLYWLCENQELNDVLGLVASNYEVAGDHIDVIMVDPLTETDFIQEFGAENLPNFSFVVASKYRYTVVSSEDFYYYTNDFVDEQLNGGNTYKMSWDEFNSFYSSYGTYMSATSSYEFFQGETLLTAAIDYVALPTVPHAYALTGHGEAEMSDTAKAALDLYNLAPEPLDLKKEGAFIPADAACITIFAPKEDISAAEAEMLKQYLATGGSVVLITSPACASFENLASVTAMMGMQAEEGLVIDPTQGNFKGETKNLLPLVNTSISPLASLYNIGYNPYMPSSHGISFAKEKPVNISYSPLLATSEKAYRISTDGEESALCDPAAQYIGGYAMITAAAADGTAVNGTLVWFASAEAFTDAAANQFSGSNYLYLSLMSRYVSDLYVSPFSSSIEGINLTPPLLEDMTTNTAVVLGVVLVVVIPMSLLISGLVIWLKRRRR